MLLTLSIRAVLPATPRTRIVRIDLCGNRFPYVAGQALLIAKHDEQPRRPYSIATAPEDAEREGFLELLVGFDAHGRVRRHSLLTVGGLVDIEGPIGCFTFPHDPTENRFVFIAGGAGIAPVRAMLRQALRASHRQIKLLYSARMPADFAYEHEFQSLAHAGRIEFRQTVTRDIAARDWAGSRGRIGRGELVPLVQDLPTLWFICGPPALVDAMPNLLEELGVPRELIRIEEWRSS